MRRKVPAMRMVTRRLAWAMAPAVLALLAASCSAGSTGPGVARVSSGSASPRRQSGALAFAACMRSHGVPGFPDPGGAMPAGLTKPQFEKGMEACRSLLPQGQGEPPSAADKQRFLRFSACVRTRGIPNYPDPVFPPQGGVMIGLPPGMDDNSPVLQAAEKACDRYFPGGGPRGSPRGG